MATPACGVSSRTVATPGKQLRVDFFRFYAARASANFSKGCHDEWNIFCEINRARLAHSNGDVGQLLAGYFDGRQIDPGAAVCPIDVPMRYLDERGSDCVRSC